MGQEENSTLPPTGEIKVEEKNPKIVFLIRKLGYCKNIVSAFFSVSVFHVNLVPGSD